MFKGLDPLTDGGHIQHRRRVLTKQDQYLAASLLWRRLVSAYSTTKLTNPMDKLIAISGVAKNLSQINGDDEYVAGLWRRTLVMDLAWYIDLWDENKISRPQEYRCPSFSWASIDGGKVERDFLLKRELLRIRDVRISYAGSDRTGLVTSGYIFVEGFLRPIHLFNYDKKRPMIAWIASFSPIDKENQAKLGTSSIRGDNTWVHRDL